MGIAHLKHKQISDANLLTYLQASRSIAAFAGMCDRGNTDDMYEAAESDMTTIYALDVLHEQMYDTAKALQSLVKNPIPQIYDKRWSEDDQKKFVKGLRQFGKNFWLIHEELLPHKTTSDIVEYYYLWKKTPAAVNSNINRRRIRPVSSAKKTATSANKTSNNGNIGSDMDSDNESDESSEQKQTSSSSSQTSCTNCYTTSSKDWQNGGQEGQLLCYDCRMYYKNYGELPQISNEQLLAANLLRNSKIAAAKAEAKKEELKSEPDVGDEDDKEVDEINNKSVKHEEVDEPQSPKKEPEIKVEAGAAELTESNRLG